MLITVVWPCSVTNGQCCETEVDDPTHAPSPQASEAFGAAVDIVETPANGTFAVVGAYRYNPGSAPNTGRALLFRLDTSTGSWVFQQPLDPPGNPLGLGDEYGRSVSISSTEIVIGAPGDDDNGTDAGAVYVFERDFSTNAYNFAAKLTANDGQAGDGFGKSVLAAGENVYVGAPHADIPADPIDLNDPCGVSNHPEGAVYAYSNATATSGVWAQTDKLFRCELTIASPGNPTEFGHSFDGFAIVGDLNPLVIVGVPGYDANAGTAVAFERVTVANHTFLEVVSVHPSGTRGGSAVSVDGDLIAVGAPEPDFFGSAINEASRSATPPHLGSGLPPVQGGPWSPPLQICAICAICGQPSA